MSEYNSDNAKLLARLAGHDVEIPDEEQLKSINSILLNECVERFETYIQQLVKKADLGADGKIKVAQLPEFVIADVVKVQTYAELPAVGDSGKVYYVENDPVPSKNGSYKWVGDTYYKYTNEENYYNVSIIGENYTMGQLEETVADINQSRQHVFFDMHNFATDAYVCLLHFTANNHCVIFDLLNLKAYGINETYTDEQLVSDYIQGNVLNLYDAVTRSDITHETWTFTLDDDSEVTKEVMLWTSQE